METVQWRDYFGDAIRYWEPRRILYNLLLAVIVAVHFVMGLPFSRSVLQFNTLLILFALAVLANVVLCSLRARCFCANVEPARFLAALPVGAVCCRPGVCSGAGAFLVSRAVFSGR